MGSTALQGKVELNHIKLGAYRFFVAPVGTSIDENAAFDTENPPAPFRDLGLASNDSIVKMSVNMFALKAGIPSLLKKKWVIERDAEMDLILEEYSPHNLARAIWKDQCSIKTFTDTPATQALPVANDLGDTLYEVDTASSSTVFDVLDATDLAEDQIVVVEALDASLPASINFARIVSVVGLTVTVTPALPSGTPSSGDKIRIRLFTNGGNSASKLITVTDGTEWTVDQFIALAQDEDDLITSPYEFMIKAINGNVLTLDRATGVAFDPYPFIGEVLSFKIPFGGGDACRFSVVAVWDDLEHGQHVVVMPYATAKGDLNLGYKSTENLKFPMTLMAESFGMNLLDEDSLQSVAGSPTPTTTVFTVDDGSLFAEGETVAVEATEALLDNSTNKGVIDSIATDAITLVDPLPIVPESGWKIKRVNSTVGALVAILHRQNTQTN